MFVTWQVEVGHFGTRHLQGYLVTRVNPRNKNGFAMKWIKEAFGTKGHFEPRIGTHEQAVAYSNKSDTRVAGPWTVGEFKSIDEHRAEAGERIKKSTLTDVKDDIDAGFTDAELWSRHTSSMLRYANAFDKYRLVISEAQPRDQPKVVVFWGPPGTGKSHKAREVCENNGGGHWFQSGNGDNAWWDGYDPVRHPVVVLDDFKGGIKYTTLLRMLDKYPLNVETKGSTRRFSPKIIVITSNSPPNQWYFQNQQDANHDSSALLRRLEGAHGAVVEMKEKYVEPELDEPDLKDVLDLLVNGTLIPRDVAVRKEYLDDVKPSESRAATAAAIVDLTGDDDDGDGSEYNKYARVSAAWDARIKTITLDEARGMQFENQEDFDRDFADDYAGRTTSDLGGDDDDGDDNQDVVSKRQHPTPPAEEVPWIDEVERDDYEAAVVRNRLHRRNAMASADETLIYTKPVQTRSGFKKLGGPIPVQTTLSLASTAPAKKRRLLGGASESTEQ